MQKQTPPAPEMVRITPTADIHAITHGGRAKCLQRLVRLEMPVPETVALSFACVRGIAEGRLPDMAALLEPFGDTPLLTVRSSSEDPDWGGPEAILNIGMCDALRDSLVPDLGHEAATLIYLRFIQTYAVHVARLEPDEFELPDVADDDALTRFKDTYFDEMDEPFPQDPARQLAEVLRSQARAWEGTSARLLRQAKGAPADAGLGLVVQRMTLGRGKDESGSGVIQFVSSTTGQPQITGRYLTDGQGREALKGKEAIYLERDPRGPSLEERCPVVFGELKIFGDLARARLREEMQIEFTTEDGRLAILDAVPVTRTARAGLRIAVTLAEDGVIPQEEAVMRISPTALAELLHRQVDPESPRDVIATGIAASPGAASGRIVLSAAEAQAMAARGEPCVLIRRETSPEDIRGMHVAKAVVTLRGGITSHAAVIGRGIGLPCVVGASDLEIDKRSNTVRGPKGRKLKAGDMVTVDGTSGALLAGEPPMLEAELGPSFKTLLGWADEARDIDIRANADTPKDAETARNFAAQGIGLCRTEHMFFDGDRIGVMREVIFAESREARQAALDRLLPMQREDIAQLFQIMAGQPVCIRLFDPPLHEFLPHDKAGMRALADGLGIPLQQVEARVEAIAEYNPMLGMRGVRLGLTVPEITEMQARAIFDAAAELSNMGDPVEPEIMIPLVSAMREVEIVAARIEAVAASVRIETGAPLNYRLGVMVETPRAALRAEDIAQHAAFLSFGTNDLTQMTYGLSRDDAGRFMASYVQQGIYDEDPFHSLDLEGVGELLAIGADRGRKGNPQVTLSICGEHGGGRAAISFARQQGFHYISCSPFRVPGARLSAAQLAIADRLTDKTK